MGAFPHIGEFPRRRATTAFFESHPRAAHVAIEAGADLRGFLVWSLMDNFEWAEGYHRRFGAVPPRR